MRGWANENNQGTTHNMAQRLAQVLCEPQSVYVCVIEFTETHNANQRPAFMLTQYIPI